MGLRGPRPLSGKVLELHGSFRAEARLKQEQEKRKLLPGILGQSFLDTFIGKDPPHTQAEIDKAIDYFVQLSPEEFCRAIVMVLRSELEGVFETKVSLTKIIELLKKDKDEIQNDRHI